MWIRIEIYNRHEELLGSLSDEPVAIGEYETYPLRLKVYSDQPRHWVKLQVNDEWLEYDGAYFLLGSNQSERGRRGQIELRVYYHNNYVALYPITIVGHRFTELHYQYLTRDLKRLLITLAASDKTDVIGSEYDWENQFIRFFDRQLEEIAQFVEQLKGHIYLIEQAPHRTVQKQYHLQDQQKPARVDARTVRWQATKGGSVSGQVQSFSNVEDNDLYENQFLVYICNRLDHFVTQIPDSFEHTLRQKESELAQRIDDWEHYQDIAGTEAEVAERREFKEKQLTRLREAQAKLVGFRREKVPDYRARVKLIQQQLRQLKQLPFLSGILPKRNFSLTPTLVLLRDPVYNAVYKGYRIIQETLHLNQLEQIDRLLGRAAQERTSKLYEYWVVLQVYAELRRMGFDDASGSAGVLGLLEKDTFRLRSGGTVLLVGRKDPYTYNETLTACLHYEYRFGPNGDFFPDIFIEFSGKSSRTLILDAKYRDYEDLPDFYDQDVIGTAKHKYKQLQRRSSDNGDWVQVEGVGDIRQQIYASFIIHSHPDPRYIDYGSSGQKNEYGAISLVPQETASNIHLKRLLRMFLRMHLHIFNVCWSDSHAEPVKATHKPKSKSTVERWEGTYNCPECGNSWWVNHCGRWCQGDGINVTKITFSDPTDNFFEMDDDGQKLGGNVLLKCSSCNRSYHHHGYY